MKNDNRVDLILASKYSFANISRQELLRWMGTTLQPAIRQQNNITKKLFLETLKDTPAIYMS